LLIINLLIVALIVSAAALIAWRMTRPIELISLSEDELRIVSLHEAGHVVVCLHSSFCLDVDAAWVMDTAPAKKPQFGLTSSTWLNEDILPSGQKADALRQRAMCTLAGDEAVILLGKRVPNSERLAQNTDAERAIGEIITLTHIVTGKFPNEPGFGQEFLEDIERIMAELVGLLNGHRSEVLAIADALFAKRRLNRTEIREIVEACASADERSETDTV
jgi:hypothetical protein